MNRLPAVRVDGHRRIDLRKQREAEAQRKSAPPPPPVEDDRVSQAWARQERRDIAAAKAAEQAKAMRDEADRPRTEVRIQKVDNPYFQPEHPESSSNPKKEHKPVNIKESAVETLYARGELTRLQKKTADTFREHFEVFAKADVSAVDYGRQPVDGGTAKAPITMQRARARKELARARAEVGSRNYKLLVSVCGQGKALGELFPGDIAKRQRLTAADNLRDCLQDIAVVWGFAGVPYVNRKRTGA